MLRKKNRQASIMGLYGLEAGEDDEVLLSPPNALRSDNSVGYRLTAWSVGHCISLKEGGETCNTFPIDDATNHVRPYILGLKSAMTDC